MPPAGSSLVGGDLDIGMYAYGYGAGAQGTATAYTPEVSPDAADIVLQCAHGASPCSPMGNEFLGELEVPRGRGGDVYLSAGCAGTAGASCDEGASGGAWSQVKLWEAHLRLANSSTPGALDGIVGGTLLAGGAGARGTQSLTFTATDYAGPGVYSVTVQADGQTLYSATPDTNSGQCVPVGSSGNGVWGSAAGTLWFDASQPCKQSEPIELPIDTTSVHDGEHTLLVSVTDAARNSSVVYDAPITTDNAPRGEHGALSCGGAGGGRQHALRPARRMVGADGRRRNRIRLSVGEMRRRGQRLPGDTGGRRRQLHRRGWRCRCSAAGTHHRQRQRRLDVAGKRAQRSRWPRRRGCGRPISAGDPGHTQRNRCNASWRSCTSRGAPRSRACFASRAITIMGQLSNSAGTPIGGATLDVREQVAGAASPKVIAHVMTAADGDFTVHVAAGPSRTVLVDYRALSSDPSYSAQAAIQETVERRGPAAHHTAPHPLDGQHRARRDACRVRSRGNGSSSSCSCTTAGTWEPFRTPRTNRAGHFAVAYQFEGGVGRFPFRAEVLGGQSGFPYAAARAPRWT